jgi:hypothetical protein
MRKLRLMISLLCAIGALYGVSLPPPAVAAGISPPVADCSAHGQLTRHYSPSQLRTALATMPADVAEYTNCSDVIRRALIAALGPLKEGGSGGGGGSFLPSWVIAVFVVLVLAGAGTAAVALRNRRRAA